MTETKSESKKTNKKKSSESTKTSDTETKDTETKDTSNSKNTKAPARTTSYFSSVSTDDYREGWKTIFSDAQKITRKKSSEFNKPIKKKDAKSFTIKLSDDVLGNELKTLLKEAIRKQARKNKLSLSPEFKRPKAKLTVNCTIKE